jgi:uncharacterized protein (TIGR02246 family)
LGLEEHMKRVLAVLVVANLFGPGGTRGSPVAAVPAGEEGPVTAVIGALEAAWNRHDMDSFASLFADDADFVNVRGMRWVGRAAIKEAHVATHSTIFKNSRLRIQETSVRFLKPDVAVARSLWELTGQTTREGNVAPPRRGILTNVLMKVEGKWRIVVTQNTDIVPAGA